jgi:uncharacterized protein YecE (DUF72 family)
MARQRRAGGQLRLFGGEANAEQTVARSLTARTRSTVAAAEVTEDLAATARQLPATVYLGTSSWSFPGWKGLVYGDSVSKGRLAGAGLAAYAQHPLLRTVGIDRTYYAPIRREAFAAYAVAVPADFRFLVKAHERCTVARFANHPRYGAQRGTGNDLFLHAGYAADAVVGPAVDGLGERVGVLLFQFPPQDVKAMGGSAGFAERLHGFLTALPRGPLYAVELRSPALVTREYGQALEESGACHCFNLHPSMPDPDEQERLLGGARMPATVVRWMLAPHLGYEAARDRYEPFDRIVDDDPGARAAVAAHCLRAVAARRPAFVIINNKAEGSAPLSVFHLAGAIVDGLRE